MISRLPKPLQPIARRIYQRAINSRQAQKMLALEIDAAFSSYLVRDFVEGTYGEKYGVTRSDREALVQSFHQNNTKITTATCTAIHIVLARQILSVPAGTEGDVIECGAYKGASTASLSLVCRKTSRRLIVCDSFEGLPDEGIQLHTAPHFGTYGYYQKGMFCGRLDEVKQNVAQFGAVEVCEFIPGYFSESLRQLSRPIVFGFLDVDLVSSTLDCLRYIWPLLVENGLLYTDDAGDMGVVKLFFDDDWWRTNLDCMAPGYVGSGCGLPLNTRYSSIGYTRRVSAFRKAEWNKASHLYYPDGADHS